MGVGLGSVQLRMAVRAFCVLYGAALLLILAPRMTHGQGAVPVAPDASGRFSASAVDWARFDRLAAIARETPTADRLADVARALRAGVPPEAGHMSPLDWHCLACAWYAYHYPALRGRPYLRADLPALEGEELYALARKGYKIGPEQAARIHARLLSMLGIPAEVVTGLVRGAAIDRRRLGCEPGRHDVDARGHRRLPAGAARRVASRSRVLPVFQRSRRASWRF